MKIKTIVNLITIIINNIYIYIYIYIYQNNTENYK